MLVIRASRSTLILDRVVAIVQIVVGTLAFVSTVVFMMLRWQAMFEGSAFMNFWFAGLSLLGGACGALQGFFELRKNLFRGGLQTGLFANSRTLAIVRYRAHTLFIKYANCVAVKQWGMVLVLSDGREISLKCDGVRGRRYLREFMEPLYAWWWPECPLPHVRAFFTANQASLSRPFLFFLALLAAPLGLLGVWNTLVGGWLPLLSIALFAVFLLCLVVPPSRRVSRLNRDLAYDLALDAVVQDPVIICEAQYAED